MTTSPAPDGNDRELRPDERELKGGWLDLGSHLLRDDVCARIEWLITNRLVLVEERDKGKTRLYRDPADGRFWEWRTLAPFNPVAGPTTLTVVDTAKAPESGQPARSSRKRGK